MPFKPNGPNPLESLPPGATAVVSSAILRLDSVREAVAPFPKAPECAAVLVACGALENCVVCAQMIESSAKMKLDRQRAAVRDAQNLLAEQFVPPGGETVEGALSKLEVIKDGVLVRVAYGCLDAATAEYRTQSDKLANAAVEAMVELTKQISIAEAKATAPLGMTSNLDLQSLSRIAATREELSSASPSRIKAILEGTIAGADAKGEIEITLAIGPLLRKWLSLSPTKLREEIGVSLGIGGAAPDSPERRKQIEDARRECSRILDLIDRRAEMRIPPSLGVAKMAQSQLTGIFGALVGHHAQVLPQDEYRRRYLSDSNAPRNALDVHPSWALRLAFASSPVFAGGTGGK